MNKHCFNLKNYAFLLIFGLFVPLLCFDDFADIQQDYVEDIFDIWANSDLEWHEGIRPAQALSPQEALNLLTCSGQLVDVELQNRLQQNFYIVTNPINKRSILDEPQFLIHLSCFPQPPHTWQFNCWVFYNQTTKGNYTKNSTAIISYLNVLNPILFGGFDDLLQALGVPFDIPSTQDLFGLVKLQERRAGGMFDFYKESNRWNFEWKIPLFYMERNFFVTEAEKRRFEALFQIEADGSFNEHVISDQVGIGDSRINIGYLAVDKEWLGLNVGFLATLPTGFAFKKGLLGSDFAQNSVIPKFDLYQIVQLAFDDPEAAQAMGVDFLMATGRKLSANLLQTGIGDDGHIGIGGFFEKHMPLTNRFTFKTRGELEYRFPTSEKRFFITKKFPQQFQELEPFCVEPPDEANQEQAVQKLTFLNDQLIATFIPRVFSVSIYPGFLFKWQSALAGFFGDTWQFGGGFDIWWQSQEKFGRIKANPTEIANIQIDLARRSMAFQNKLFGYIHYQGHTTKRAWSWTLYGDYTVLSTGIGKDFNLSFQISVDYC